jgi:urea transport system permease protein
LRNEGDRHVLYLIVVVVLGIVYLIARQLVRSRYGRLLVAVRDGEDRVRFLGYDPAKVKTSAFAVSAGMAGLAGALFVPVVGIISPALLGVVPSIEMVIWVAVGGRATIYGAAFGAVVVNWAKTNLSERYPSGWLYFQGALFVIVMMFAPRGLVGLRNTVSTTWAKLRARFDWRDRSSTMSSAGAANTEAAV